MRRRRRSLAPILILAVCLVIIGLYVSYRRGLEPASASGRGQIFTVKAGQDAQIIATNLISAHLIRDRDAFITYVNFHGDRPKLKAGEYYLAPTLSASVIANDIAAGKTYVKYLTIPEGFRLTQIEAAASKDGISTAAFQAALAAPHSNSFLASKPADVSLEGYLFPATYAVDAATSAASLVNEMLTAFGTAVGPSYTQAFASEGLTLHQGLTIASIVEAEVANPSDQPIVAQIFLKRLKIGMPLGSDETAQYASDLAGVTFSTTIKSPYNTLLAPGLPPGPICSPGLGALNAVAHPADTDYLYFLTGTDGKTYYATTYAQHEANIAKYLN